MTTTTRLTCRTTLQNAVESTHDGYSLLSLALICLQLLCGTERELQG